VAEPIVTIDGPAGSGKSTLARALARRMGYLYLESGALYRTVALAALRRGLNLADAAAVARLVAGLDLRVEDQADGLRVFLGREEVTGFLRAEEVGRAASDISRLEAVRQRLNELQRRLGRRGGLVVEGRDAGTVVFPEAEVKFFLTADLAERARRRTAQLVEEGLEADPARIMTEMAARDEQDRSRRLAPLKPAQGAIIIDTTGLNPDQVLEIMLAEVGSRHEKA